MTDGACVFCRIVAGREACSRVHEDDISLGFMGIRPARPGELMIIPKEHIDHFCDIPDDLAAHILLVAQRLSRAIRRTLSPPRVGLVVHGFGVPHAHLIVVPQHEDDISLGFMGIRPARPGELMIIPKEHVDHFCDIPDDLAAHILLVAQRLSRSIRRTLSPRRVGLVVHGFGVPHAHLPVA